METVSCDGDCVVSSGQTLDRLALFDQETMLNPMVHFDLEMAHTII